RSSLAGFRQHPIPRPRPWSCQRGRLASGCYRLAPTIHGWPAAGQRHPGGLSPYWYGAGRQWNSQCLRQSLPYGQLPWPLDRWHFHLQCEIDGTCPESSAVSQRRPAQGHQTSSGSCCQGICRSAVQSRGLMQRPVVARLSGIDLWREADDEWLWGDLLLVNRLLTQWVLALFRVSQARRPVGLPIEVPAWICLYHQAIQSLLQCLRPYWAKHNQRAVVTF